MIKRLSIALLIFLLSLLLTNTVLAAYYIDIDVTESNGTNYDMLAMKTSMDVDYLVSNGFIADDGLDVRLKNSQGADLPFMLADDKLMFASAIEANKTTGLQITTGNTPLSSFPIVVGDGGYVTIADNANLEPGNNFEIEFDGWMDMPSSLAFDDFEWGSDGDPLSNSGGDITWTVMAKGSSKVEIDTAQHYSGTRSARLYRDGTNSPDAYFPQTGISGGQILSAWIRKEDTAQAALYHGHDGKAITVQCASDEDLNWYDGSITHDTGTDVPVDEWFLLQCRNLDWNAGTFDIYLNGVLAQSGATMRTSTGWNDKVTIYNQAGDSNVWYDNIAVWEGNYVVNDHPSFPTVAATVLSAHGTPVSSHTDSLPSGIQSGDLLLVVFQTQYGDAHDVTWPPSGWTSLAHYGSNTLQNLCVAYKVATGSEGSSLTVTTSIDVRSVRQTFRITDYSGTPELAGTSSETTSDTPNPPNLSPTWGCKPTLWIAGFGGLIDDGGGRTVSSYPSGYSDGLYREQTAGYVCVGTARKVEAKSSEDPGVFTLSDSIYWRTFTIGVRGVEPVSSFVKKEGVFFIYPDGGDLCATMNGATSTKEVTTTLNNGEHTVKVWADGINFGLDVDGVTEDSVALAGVTIFDNSNDWIIENIPYYNYYKHTTSSTLRITYQPASIISGTTLPNEESPIGTYDGTITWGSNPAGISISTSGLGVEESYYYTGGETSTTDIFEPEPAELAPGQDSDKLDHNPLKPGVEGFAEASNGAFTESLVWYGIAWLSVIAVGIALIILVKEHLVFAAAVAFGLSIFWYVNGVFDYWVLIVLGILLGASLIHEKQPTW